MESYFGSKRSEWLVTEIRTDGDTCIRCKPEGGAGQNCSDLYLNFSILRSFKQPFAIPISSAMQRYSYPFRELLEGQHNPTASSRLSCF